MSSIGPNIGSILQSQISAGEAAKNKDTQRNQQVQDSRQLARLADRKKHEVEDTDHAEGVRVHRPGDEQRNAKKQQDTYEQDQDAPPEDSDNNEQNLCDSSSYEHNSQAPANKDSQPEPDDPQPHIDLTA